MDKRTLISLIALKLLIIALAVALFVIFWPKPSAPKPVSNNAHSQLSRAALYWTG